VQPRGSANGLGLAHKVAEKKGKARENHPHEPVEELDVDLEPEIEEINLDSMAIDEGELDVTARSVTLMVVPSRYSYVRAKTQIATTVPTTQPGQ
jgi:hypothetical protein